MLPEESGWSSRAPACWARAETEPQWQPPPGRHSYWCTVCKSSWGWAAPPAPGTTASSKRLHRNKWSIHCTETAQNETKKTRVLTRNIGVREVLWDPPLVHLKLQCVHFIDISRHSVDVTHRVSYIERPQEGPMFPPLHRASGKCNLSTPNWFWMVPGSRMYLSLTKQNKENKWFRKVHI